MKTFLFFFCVTSLLFGCGEEAKDVGSDRADPLTDDHKGNVINKPEVIEPTKMERVRVIEKLVEIFPPELLEAERRSAEENGMALEIHYSLSKPFAYPSGKLEQFMESPPGYLRNSSFRRGGTHSAKKQTIEYVHRDDEQLLRIIIDQEFEIPSRTGKGTLTLIGTEKFVSELAAELKDI